MEFFFCSSLVLGLPRLSHFPHLLSNLPAPNLSCLLQPPAPEIPSFLLHTYSAIRSDLPFFLFKTLFVLVQIPFFLFFFFPIILSITHKWLLVLHYFLITHTSWFSIIFYWTYMEYWNRYSCLTVRLVCYLGMQPSQLHWKFLVGWDLCLL